MHNIMVSIGPFGVHDIIVPSIYDVWGGLRMCVLCSSTACEWIFRDVLIVFCSCRPSQYVL